MASQAMPRDLNSAHLSEGGHEFIHLMRSWGIAERYRRNCIDENENIRLFMSITMFDTPRQASRYFTDYHSEDIYDWTDQTPLWDNLHPQFSSKPDSTRYSYVGNFDFYAKGFPENLGSTSWGAEVRYGRHVLEFPIERINPGIQIQLV